MEKTLDLLSLAGYHLKITGPSPIGMETVITGLAFSEFFFQCFFSAVIWRDPCKSLFQIDVKSQATHLQKLEEKVEV